jgi:hypothetical protein
MPVSTLYFLLLCIAPFVTMSHSQSIQIVTGVVPRTLDTYPYDSTSIMHFQFTGIVLPSRYQHPQNCSNDNHHCYISSFVTKTLESMFVAISEEYHSLLTEDPLTVTTGDNYRATWRFKFETPFLNRSTYDYPYQMNVSLPHASDSSLHRRRPRSLADEPVPSIDPPDSIYPLLYRPRRSLDFIGDFAKYCCSIATNNDFNLLRSTSEQIKSYSDSIKGSVSLNHNDFVRTNTRISVLSSHLQHALSVVLREQQNIF